MALSNRNFIARRVLIFPLRLGKGFVMPSNYICVAIENKDPYLSLEIQN
jgi:hypothetical protein